MTLSWGQRNFVKRNLFGSFSLVPLQYVMHPQFQSRCHYIVNHYVKKCHVPLGGANNLQPLSWEGWGEAQTEKIHIFFYNCRIFLKK